MRKILSFLVLALITAVTAGAETWQAGDEIAAANLKAGDIILMKNANTANTEALWFGGYHILKKRLYTSACDNYSLGMFPAIKNRSAFELVAGPTMKGSASFYFKEVATGEYIKCTFDGAGFVELTADINSATSFIPTKKSSGNYLVSYSGDEAWGLKPFHSYGEMHFGTGGNDMAGFKFYKAEPTSTSFLRGDQIDCTELSDGLEIMLCVPYCYFEDRSRTLGHTYLENRQLAAGSDAHKYVSTVFSEITALATSVGYNEDNVWVLEKAANATIAGYSDSYYLKSKTTGEYIFRDADTHAQSSATTTDKTKAMTFTFAPGSVKKYETGYAAKYSLYNDKTVSILNGETTYKYFGSVHGYGFAIFNTENFANWNIYKIAPVTDDTKKQEAYAKLQELIATDEAKYTGEFATDHLPGYDASSVTAYQSALAAAKTITIANTLDEINDAYNNLNGLPPTAQEIENGGYYYAVSANTKSSETLALRIQAGDTKLGYGVLDKNSGSFVFKATKSTNNSNYWFFQNFDTDLYIGRAQAWYNQNINVSETPADNNLQALVGKDKDGVEQAEAYYWNNVYDDAGSFGLTFVPNRFGWHANTDSEATEGLIYNFAAVGDPANYNYNRWFLVPVPEDVIQALQEAKEAAMFETLTALITSYESEGIQSEYLPGFTAASVATYETALATAKSVSATDNYETKKAAYDALKAAHLALVALEIEDGNCYYIVSAYTGRTDKPAVTINTEISTTDSRWALLDKNDLKFVFKFSADAENGGYWYLMNLANGYYISENDYNDFNHSYNQDGVVSENAEHSQYFKRLITSGLPYAYFWYSHPYNFVSWYPNGYGGSATSGKLHNFGAEGDPNTDNHNRWFLYPVSVEEVTIGATGYSTYQTINSLIVPEGVTAYGVTGLDGTEIELTPLTGNILAAGEPVILQGEAGKTYYFIATDEAGSSIAGNLLEGTGGEEGGYGLSVGENEAYVLYNNEGTAVFRIAAAITLPTKKAYLPASVIDGTPSKEFKLSGELTGLQKFESANVREFESVFDLTGRKVAAPQKGNIYIVNGKAVLY